MRATVRTAPGYFAVSRDPSRARSPSGGHGRVDLVVPVRRRRMCAVRACRGVARDADRLRSSARAHAVGHDAGAVMRYRAVQRNALVPVPVRPSRAVALGLQVDRVPYRGGGRRRAIDRAGVGIRRPELLDRGGTLGPRGRGRCVARDQMIRADPVEPMRRRAAAGVYGRFARPILVLARRQPSLDRDRALGRCLRVSSTRVERGLSAARRRSLPP